MPILTYSVRDEKGKLVKGSSDVRTKEELVRSLHAQGFTVIAIDEQKQAAPLLRIRKRLHKGVRAEDLTMFARQMAVLLDSGVTIIRAITVLTQQIESQTLLQVCKKIEEDLKAGSSLKDAIAKHPRIFSQIWVDLIETGESTGQLGFVLQKLATYFEEMASLRKKVVSALIYPVILILVSLAAIFVFMYKVIPVFAGIYKGFGKMPGITMAVIGVSDFITKNIFKIVIGLAILVFILSKYVKTREGKKRFDDLKLRIPIAGDLFLSIAIERFTTSLGMMLKGGISIVHALEIAIKSTGNKVIEEALDKVRTSVIQGKTISVPLAETGVFPPLVTQMISVGEESGKLSQLLDEVSKYYAEEISIKVTRFVALFEPALLVIMGVIIGTLVVAMYLPIFSIATTTGVGG